MFAPSVTDSTPLGAADVDRAVAQLATVGAQAEVDDAALVGAIRSLEELKSAAAAAQARLTVRLHRSVREQHAALRLPTSRHGQGVGAQVALARRESPARGGRLVGLAQALVHEMPHTLRALTEGRLSEWRATLLVRETACLTREHRSLVDRTLMAAPDATEGWGDRRLVAEAKRLAYRLDPEAALRRVRKAEAERRVSVRPAPDTMTYLTGLLPVAAGVATWAALVQAADAAKAAGDGRTRGQIMADTLVSRVTGAEEAGSPTGIEIQLVMTDRALLGDDPEPAVLTGHGPVPAGFARGLVRDSEADVFVRRLWVRPHSGDLAATESSRRLFPGHLRRHVVLRDQTCRTPWCDAPVRHADHVVAHAAGGPTSLANGQGLCEACDYTKQAPGWRASPVPGPRHTVETTTPSGHHYRSSAPRLPGAGTRTGVSPPSPRSRLEVHFTHWVLCA
ncbi:MAG: DUF222 domain-containing protein [Nocardioidaceae bacterium]